MNFANVLHRSDILHSSDTGVNMGVQ